MFDMIHITLLNDIIHFTNYIKLYIIFFFSLSQIILYYKIQHNLPWVHLDAVGWLSTWMMDLEIYLKFFYLG